MIWRVSLNRLAMAALAARFPDWALPTAIFVVALGVTLAGAARYTILLERLTEHEHLSLELLGFGSALGANIPNYVASLAAFVGGHGLVGVGIIVGSNIYNIAVILSLAALATRGRGILLSDQVAGEVRYLAWLVAAMGGLMFLLVLTISIAPVPAQQILRVMLSLTILLLFTLVVRDALRPSSGAGAGEALQDTAGVKAQIPLHLAVGAIILRALLALGVTLVGVVIMVQAGQASAADLGLSPVILSLVVLAVATSLPNTVVAYQLARTEGGGTSLEEILSSNAINLALGGALPLLIWTLRAPGGLLTWLDMPLLALLGLTIIAFVCTRRIPRWSGIALFAVYAVWIVLHVLL
jgi:cation:H+ antiporter